MLLGRNMRGTPLVAMHKDIRRLKPDSFPPQAVIFADPPYEQSRELWLELGPKLQPWLRNDGVLVWETDGTTELIACQGWHLADVRKYGAARFHFFEPTGR